VAVYRRAYRPYVGPLTPERSRFLAVSRYALAELSESRVLMAFVVLCLFPFLIEAIGIYIANSGAARALLRISGHPDAMKAEFFGMALTIQGGLAVLLSAWVAPVLVSPDLVNGALPLYLSRPLSRTEYVLGKAAALALLLSSITWVPVLTLFSLQAGLAPAQWLSANLRLAWAILAGSWIWITVLTLLGLALSAWIRWRLVASASLFAVFFMGAAFGEVWSEVLTTPWGRLANLAYMMAVILVELFGTLPSQATSREMRELMQLPVWAAVAGLVAVCAVSLWMLDRRLRAREVVS
jgi:ABC-type transport system involved in multi-copper enzyme maturation permease subunit